MTNDTRNEEVRDTLLAELADAMSKILKMQERLNALKDAVASERGPGTWTFQHLGKWWVLRVTRTPNSKPRQFDVYLQPASKV